LEGTVLFHLRLDVYASDSNLWQPRLEKVSTYGRNTRETFRSLAQYTHSSPFYATRFSLAGPASLLEYAKFCIQTQTFLSQPEPREQVGNKVRDALFRSIGQRLTG